MYIHKIKYLCMYVYCMFYNVPITINVKCHNMGLWFIDGGY